VNFSIYLDILSLFYSADQFELSTYWWYCCIYRWMNYILGTIAH